MVMNMNAKKNQSMQETSADAKLIAAATYKQLRISSHIQSTTRFWRKYLIPKLREGYLDQILPDQENTALRDEVLTGITEIIRQYIYSSDHHNTESYLIEVASLLGDVTKRNALYFEIAGFVRGRDYSGHSFRGDSYRRKGLDVIFEAYARIEPQTEAEREEIRRQAKEGSIFEYAKKKLEQGDLETSLKAFKICNNTQMMSIITAMMRQNPKKYKINNEKKGKDDKGRDDDAKTRPEKTGLDQVLKD